MKFFPFHIFVILLCNVKVGWSEVCSSLVEDISVNQCNPNQRSSKNQIEPSNSDLNPKQSCTNFIQNVSHRVISSDHGIVTYSIALPPAECRYTRYTFKIIASNSSLCKHIDQINSRGNHGNGSSVASLHSNYAYEYSVKNVRVQWCNDSSCRPSCSNTLYLTFEYVSTQCYQLVAQPFISQDSQIQLYSNWHFIDTKYIPILPHMFVPQFDWRHDSNENSVLVRLIINSSLTQRPLASCLEIMSGVEASGKHACYETGNRMSQCLVWFGDRSGESSVSGGCDKDRSSDSTAVSKCTSETENELVCSIENVTVGNYCVVMQFLDERCQGSENVCSWHKMFVVNNKSSSFSSYSSIYPPSSSVSDSFLSPSLLLIMSIVMLLGVAAILIVRTCHRRSLSMSHYKHFVLPMSRAPSSVVGSTGSSVILREKKILLLYARDCDQVLSVVQALKTLLQNAGKCQVFDYWDVDHFNCVARNPMAWINAHLSDEDTSVIILNTQVAQLLLHSQLGTAPSCSQPPATEAPNEAGNQFDFSAPECNSLSRNEMDCKLSNLPGADYNPLVGRNVQDALEEEDLVGRNGQNVLQTQHLMGRNRQDTLPTHEVYRADTSSDRCLLKDAHKSASIVSQRLEPTPCSKDTGGDHWMPLLGEAPSCQISAPAAASTASHSCHLFSTRMNVKYKEAKCFDHLFALGVRSVALHCTNATGKSMTERVYIVEFDVDLQSLCSSFLLPITLTRFILPDHMESLLYHIHSISPLSKQFALDSTDDDYLKLKHCLDLLAQHRTRYPQYPLDLLVNVV